MTGSEDAFDDFVRVRWGDLEPVARLVVLEPQAAREATTTALVRLRAQWAETAEGGRPVALARRLVLGEAVARSSTTTGGPGSPLAPDLAPDLGPDPATTDPVVAGLVGFLHDREPLDRALLAADRLWGLPAHEVALLLDLPSADLRRRERSLERSLEDAHTAARERAGLSPDPWGVEQDLTAAIDVLLRDLTDPPDPAALVDARRRGVRRRTLLGGGAAAAAVAGVGTVVAVRGGSGPSAPPAAALPPPGDRSWLSTATWAARGPLAADPQLRVFLRRRGALGDRVLWAGDAGTRRLVVLWTRPQDPNEFGTALKLFSAERGSDLLTLDPVEVPYPFMPATDSVAAILPDGPAVPVDPTVATPVESATPSLLLVLARPHLTTASYSSLVRPRASGAVERSWTEARLDGGVAVVEGVRGSAALRVRYGAYDGEPMGYQQWYYGAQIDVRPDPAEGVETFVENVTGIPADELDTVEVSRDEISSSPFEDPSLGTTPPAATAVRLRTTTPDGAVLRSCLVTTRQSVAPLEYAVVVPAADADAPTLQQVGGEGPDGARFLVLHPPAATVQLVDGPGAGTARSRVVRCAGRGATEVEIGSANDPNGYRVVLKDARGRTVHDGPPVNGRYVLDT